MELEACNVDPCPETEPGTPRACVAAGFLFVFHWVLAWFFGRPVLGFNERPKQMGTTHLGRFKGYIP